MNSDYYVRSRGRVRGPFTLAALQRRLRAGTLSRFDQVSTDRKNWDPVSKLAELQQLDPPIKLAPVAETEPAEKESKPVQAPPKHAEEPATIPLAPLESDQPEEEPPLTPLGRPRPRGWVGTAVSGGLLIVLAVNLPQTANEDGLRYWWMRDALIQLTDGALLLLGALCASLPIFVRRRAEVWLGGVGSAVLLTLAFSVLLAGDASRIMGSLDLTASTVVGRLAVLQAVIFGTLLITALVLVTMAAAIWLSSGRASGVDGKGLYE